MKKLRDILGEAAPRPIVKKSDTTGLQIGPVKFRKASDIGSDIMSGLGSAGSAVGTAFNQVLNPVRRAIGVETGELPKGTKEVDYGSMAKSALGVFDTAMSGFGGADPGKKSFDPIKNPPTKIQDRVPQEIPRNNIDKAPERKNSVALQRQMAGDKSPNVQSPQDKLKMMRVKSDFVHDQFTKKMDADRLSAMNKQLAPVSNEKAPVEKTKLKPKVGSLVAPHSGYPAAEKPKAPIVKEPPEQSEITIQKGQKIWSIANGDPKRVKEILKLNPGLNPNKMPIGYKLKLK